MNAELIEVEAKTKSVIITKTLIGQADDLAEEHEQFNIQYIVSGRIALYDLLRRIYELAERLDVSLDKNDQVSLMRKVLAEKYQIRTQENTPELTVLVRYITRADRKTAHVYARAIEAARFNQIPPLKLPGYLEEQGGLDRVRTFSIDGPGFTSDSDSEERADLTRRYLAARKQYPVSSFKFSKTQLAQLGGPSELSVLLCSESRGRYSVLGRVPLDAKLEKKIIDVISRRLPTNLSQARKNVENFYRRAMKKREVNMIREMIRQKPKVAEVMLRIQRNRSGVGKPKGLHHD